MNDFTVVMLMLEKMEELRQGHGRVVAQEGQSSER